MPMRLASEAPAGYLKIEQKDRARFVRKVAFFATANCAWDWNPSFQSRRRVGNIGNHRDTHGLSVCRNVFRRKVAGMHRVQAVWLSPWTATRPYDAKGPLRHVALSILRSFRDADGRSPEVVILRAAEESDRHPLPSAG